MQYDTCLRCTSLPALVAALKPFGLTTTDEEGNDVLLTASHDHALAWFGPQVQTPALMDGETEITPAVMWPGEYAILHAEETILDQITGATMADVEVLDEPPAGCPTFGGWRSVPVVDAAAVLADAQTAACAQLDAQAETLRNTVLTPGAGQMAAYQAKEDQASALLNDPTPTEAEYPDIYNEIGITADSAAGVAMAVQAAAEKWRTYGRAVERARLAGKKAVSEATDVAGVLAARDAVVWPG